MKKILIFHTSIGLGHKTMAENICTELKSAGYEVRLEDIYKVQGGRLVDFGTWLHHIINVYLPFVWSFLYTNRLFTQLSLPFRIRVASKNCQNAKKIIQEYNPDLIITVQAAASAVIAYLKKTGAYAGPFGIGFSDFHLHRYWLYDEADFYLANIEEQKREMVALDIPADKIFVCGMCLKPKMEINASLVKAKLGINPEKKVILLGSGSLGTGIEYGLIKELAAEKKFHAVVFCGKNKKAYQKLLAGISFPNVTILGFYSPMQELYAIADIFITKPGGLSITEALQYRLPMIISYMLPGQEKFNYDYLVEKHLIMPKPKNLILEVRKELETGVFKNSLLRNKNINNILRENCIKGAVNEIFSRKYNNFALSKTGIG
ncbi:MAG: hypothetical protein M1383_01210 [Patescibacteria group bacterium]|nr:hypothetical protein [Patescibacteria group bacterium]